MGSHRWQERSLPFGLTRTARHLPWWLQESRPARPRVGVAATTVFGLLLAAAGSSQEVDTVLFRERVNGFTILDQAEDAGERRAIKEILAAASPARKKALAEKFLMGFPDSALLSGILDIAAKSSIDAGDLAGGIHHARQSLRMTPENPLLLVAIADAEATLGRLREAAVDAREALYQLERFDKPASFGEKRWERLRLQLEATGRAVLGRAALADALASERARRLELARSAVDELVRSRSLQRTNPSTAYLLGIAHALLDQPDQAAANLADAVRAGGQLAERAAVHLRRALGLPPETTSAELDRIVVSMEGPALHPPAPNRDTAPRENARYAGSSACRGCHTEIHDSWARTGMGRMFRPWKPEDVLADFGAGAEVLSDDGAVEARIGISDGRHYIELPDGIGGWQRHRIDHVIGSKWQQAYATELANGSIHVLPVQYSAVQGRWLNFWKVIDPPGTERADLGAFHRMSRATNYQVNCASCHTSQLAAAQPLRPVDFRHGEAGVNCEMCHGPSADHAAAASKGVPGGTPVRFGEIGAERYVSICGQCHMQSNLVEIGPSGEVNFTGRSPDFDRSYKGRPLNEFSAKATHRDGRFRETTFIGESFVRTACYRLGGAHCGNCHNPHPPDPERNPASLKHPDAQDRMCLQCHSSYGEAPELHTRHSAGSEGSRCASCHMPKIMHALLFEAATHRIDDIPDAEATRRFGRQHSPNACLLCHADRDDVWLARQLRDWPRGPDRPE